MIVFLSRQNCINIPGSEPFVKAIWTAVLWKLEHKNATTQTLQLVSDDVLFIMHSYNWLHLIIRPTENQTMSFRNIFRIHTN